MLRLRTTLVATLLLASAACGGARRAGTGFEMGPEAAKERARADSLRYPYTKADIDFMMGMIHHHAQAIQISRWAPAHQAGAEVIRLTERIINAQTDEIMIMRQWLGDRHQSPPTVDSLGNLEMDHSQHGAGAMAPMPGMLTPAQLAELDAARGMEFDRLFLTFMIQHHRGAVQMVRELFSHQGAGQDETIFKFAADVEVDQSTEIKRMLQMLITLDNGMRAP
jgi:uncharacterized protein (DUF305 family)